MQKDQTDSTSSTFHHVYHQVHLKAEASRSVLWQVLAEFLEPFVPPNARVIELGAGYCYWINAVHATSKVAVDAWEELDKYAAPDVLPIRFDLSLGLDPLGISKFDVVLASNLFEHFEPEAASSLIAQVYARLNVNGRLIIIQPNFRYAYRSYFDDFTHRTIFTEVSLAALLQAHGFQIEKLMPKFTPYSLKASRLPITPWLIRLYLKSPIKPFAGQMLIIGKKGDT